MRPLRAIPVAFLVLAATGPVGAGQDIAALKSEGGQIIKELAGSLQTELKAAMQAGGPLKALEVCNLSAQDLTVGVSDAHDGWSISRASHRLRNPANAPDDYTAATIDAFLARAAEGEDVASLMSAEIVETDGARAFRMVKAIPTGAVCLQCHGGTEVSADVEAALADTYPEDAARGFSAGDMRGVFTLSKPLD
jgi:hypothetical protein